MWMPIEMTFICTILYFCGSKGPSAQRELVCLYLGISLECLCLYLSLCTQTCTHGSLCFVDRYTLLQSSGGTACPLSLVLPLASTLPTSSYTTSLNAPPRLLLCRFLLWLPITYSVKAPCSLLASKAQSCSRLRLCFFLRRAFWMVGPWPSLRGQANTMVRHQGLVAGSGTDSQGGESWGVKSSVMKAIPSLHLGQRNPPDLESLAPLLSPEPSLCSPVKIALCDG